MFNIDDYNSKAWDRLVEYGNEWTVPVSHEEIEKARKGQWQIFLTPTKPVPKKWFPELKGLILLSRVEIKYFYSSY